MKCYYALAWGLLLAGSAGAQSFEELSKLYDYNKAKPLNPQIKEIDSRGGYRLSSVRYDLPKIGHVPGYLVVPDGNGRRPAIIWMHSAGALQFLGNAVLMSRLGVVSLLVGQSEDTPTGTPEASRDQLIYDVVALRRAVDLLETREDVDPTRLAFVGHSYGAMMGAVAISIDRRFQAAVFECGLLGMSVHIGTSPGSWAENVRKQAGDGLQKLLETISVVDDKHYIDHAPAIPKLFQSAWYDPGVPHKDSEDFYKEATGPKQLKWYDTGHDIDDMAATADRVRFLADTLHLSKPDRVLREDIGVR